MQCSDDGCSIVKKHDEKLFNEDHGVFAQINQIRLCAIRKVTWTSLVSLLSFIVLLFGGAALITWANAKEVPELKVKVDQVEKDNIEIKVKQQVILENTKETKQAVEDIKKLILELHKTKTAKNEQNQ
jgi:hypothetical protein